MYPAWMAKRNARIDALKRYIFLLEREEKRLTWLKSSQSVTEQERMGVESNLRLNTDKITKAETELKTLEVRRGSSSRTLRI